MFLFHIINPLFTKRLWPGQDDWTWPRFVFACFKHTKKELDQNQTNSAHARSIAHTLCSFIAFQIGQQFENGTCSLCMCLGDSVVCTQNCNIKKCPEVGILILNIGTSLRLRNLFCVCTEFKQNVRIYHLATPISLPPYT